MFEYFISYNYLEKHNRVGGSGSCSVIREKKISSFNDILDIQKIVKKDCDFKKVVVKNFILLNENVG